MCWTAVVRVIIHNIAVGLHLTRAIGRCCSRRARGEHVAPRKVSASRERLHSNACGTLINARIESVTTVARVGPYWAEMGSLRWMDQTTQH